MNVKHLYRLFLIFSVIFFFTGCVPGDGSSSPEFPAGWLWGIWHGWIAPISLVISLFNDSVHIYEVNNTGFWYDLAYYAAIIGGFGGLQLSRKRKHRKDNRNK